MAHQGSCIAAIVMAVVIGWTSRAVASEHPEAAVTPPPITESHARVRGVGPRIAAVVIETAALGRASAQTPVLFGFVDTELRLAVRQAVEGAAVRLARPGCQEVLSDFTDQSGQSLSTKLKASGTSPSDALSLLRFFDDRGAPQCRSAMMFTQTGSRLIRVCAGQFSDGFRRNRTMTEIIIIHELLHTLGLGENPPTSAAITEQVGVICGG